MLKELIETNIRQRGSIDCSAIKLGRIITTLEQIYNKDIDEEENCLDVNIVQDMLGMNRESYRLAKKLMALIPELQDMVEEGNITQSVASRIIARLSPEEQLALYERLPRDVKLSSADIKSVLSDKDEDIETMVGKISEANKALKEKDRQIELANKEVNAYKKKLEDRDIDVAGQYIAQRDKAVESARRAHEKYIAANEEVSRVKNKLRSMEKQIYEAPERETDPAVKKEIETLRQKVRELEEQRELEKEASKTNARAAAELISYLEEASDTIRLFASRVCNASPNEQSEIEKKTRKLISEADQVLSSIRSAV